MDEQDINIDTSVLKDKKSSSLSLTDKYNIHLFTDKTQNTINKADKNKELDKKDILFIEKLNKNNNIYLNAKESLFIEDRKLIENNNTDELVSKKSYIISGIVMALFIIVMLFYHKLKRRRLNDVDIDYYYE